MWDVEVVNPEGLGEVVYSATTSLKPLSLSMGDLEQQGDQVSLDFSANTSDTDGTVSFYLDEDNGGYDGQLIESMADSDGAGQWSWNSARFRGGEYWVYATLDDESGIPVMSYAAQSIFINNAPKAEDDAAEADEGAPVIIDVLANDSDYDEDLLSIISLTDPSKGSAIITEDGRILFTPADDGQYTFSYTIHDGNGGESTASVTVVVAEGDTIQAVTSYWHGNAPIEGVSYGEGVRSAHDGKAALHARASGLLQLSPGLVATAGSSEAAAVRNAIKVTDAITVLQGIVGLKTFDSCQQIAADINGNGSVDVNDAIDILKYVVGLSVVSEPSWVFVEKPDTQEPVSVSPLEWEIAGDTEIALIGILRGDADGSWAGVA